MELETILVSVVVPLASFLISYLTAKQQSKHEIKKMNMQWQHNYNEEIRNELGELAKHITGYLQYPSKAMQIESCKRIAQLEVKTTGNLQIALNDLHNACESGSISETKNALKKLNKCTESMLQK